MTADEGEIVDEHAFTKHSFRALFVMLLGAVEPNLLLMKMLLVIAAIMGLVLMKPPVTCCCKLW